MAAAAVAAAIASPRYAEAASYYQVDCGWWAGARATGEGGAVEGYVLGALAGIALTLGSEFWTVGGTTLSKEQVFLWVDKFCRENPLKDVAAGLGILFVERTGQPFPDPPHP